MNFVILAAKQKLRHSVTQFKEQIKTSKRGRKKLYHDPLIAQVLTDIWVATNLACAKRLKAMNCGDKY